jgi:hypothetical protein
LEADAQRTIESAQWRTSRVKMGERLDGMESGIESIAMVGSGFVFFNATVPSNTLIRITVRGTIMKPEKQPLPMSCGMAAVWL